MKVKKQACKYEDRYVTGMYDRSNTWRWRDMYDDAYHDMYGHIKIIMIYMNIILQQGDHQSEAISPSYLILHTIRITKSIDFVISN